MRALKKMAGDRGQSLSAMLRDELERTAAQPSNAEVVKRLARRFGDGGPTTDEIVAEIRKTREAS